MNFKPGISIWPTAEPLGFRYGQECFGPPVERRRLDDIRQSLKDPRCQGPEIVYSIAMDVGKIVHKQVLEDRMLLFGLVTYAQGRLGEEPIRSQGHIHKVSAHSGWAPPEIYEIWAGKAVIYMQETAQDNPGRCYAVYAQPGDVVIVPPNWAHATISAEPEQQLTFGAWCDREYGFLYEDVRTHQGLAWYPIFDGNNSLTWLANNQYLESQLVIKEPDDYAALGLRQGVPIYTQFENNPDVFRFVSNPQWQEKNWAKFIP